jgi:hypothetical protein
VEAPAVAVLSNCSTHTLEREVPSAFVRESQGLANSTDNGEDEERAADEEGEEEKEEGEPVGVVEVFVLLICGWSEDAVFTDKHTFTGVPPTDCGLGISLLCSHDDVIENMVIIVNTFTMTFFSESVFIKYFVNILS